MRNKNDFIVNEVEEKVKQKTKKVQERAQKL